jgi:hypothetical protein
LLSHNMHMNDKEVNFTWIDEVILYLRVTMT